ncbi:acylneuraminate cytidylyltransferase family protein [bacterium]|mgnify:CR=1 FL=1|nr:acylneuraminate cytidylyltransferase family protein [bacterium]
MKSHSERIPNKNIKTIATKPLCRWVLDTLLDVEQITKIIINTDSSEIVKLCSFDDRIVIHKRPDELVGDHVSMNKIINYDINKLEGEHFLQTHVTNPLIKPITIKKAINKYFDNMGKYDSLFSVTKLKTRLYNHQYQPINHDPKKLERTQDLKSIFEENSNIYLFSKQSFIKNKNRIGKNPYFFEIDSLEAIDIDIIQDFHLAEHILSNTKDFESQK